MSSITSETTDPTFFGDPISNWHDPAQFLWRALTHHKLLGLCVCLLVWTLVIGFWTHLPRTYGSEALILVSPDHVNTSPLAGEQGATFIRTQVELLKTDKIIEAAVARVGRENLTSESKSLGQMISSFLTDNCHTITLLGRTDCAEKLVPVQFIARFLPKDVEQSPEAFRKGLQKALWVQNSERNDLVRVGFSSSNPEIAAKFVNAVVAAYLEEYKQLYADTATAAFLDRQIQEVNEKLTAAQQGLTQFSTENQIYSLSVQRDALLARLSQLSNTVTEAKVALAQKTKEQVSVETQLAQLRPMIMTSEQLGGMSPDEVRKVNQSGEKSSLVKDPPLLLVKVYQETAQLVITKNMEKTGLTANLQQQATELEAIQQKLDALVAKEAQFNALTTTVASLEKDLTMLRDKAREEKLRTAMGTRDLSIVRFAQKAMPSPIAVGPSTFILIAGLGGGLMLGGLTMLTGEVRATSKVRAS